MRAQSDWFELAKSCETRVLPEVWEQEDPLGAAALSAAERRGPTLAALGHTNREISRLLHVTVSTVEPAPTEN